APPQRREMADEVGEILEVIAEMIPVHPAGLIVLAVGVVVAALRIADLVAGEQQRRALRQQHAGELVAAQPPPQPEDGGIVGRTLMAAIVAVVVVGAVAIVLAVRQIVFLVVGKEIGERETVMHRDVVDGSTRSAAVMTEQIGGGGHPARYFADETAF